MVRQVDEMQETQLNSNKSRAFALFQCCNICTEQTCDSVYRHFRGLAMYSSMLQNLGQNCSRRHIITTATKLTSSRARAHQLNLRYLVTNIAAKLVLGIFRSKCNACRNVT
jgi:hypothetical protein